MNRQPHAFIPHLERYIWALVYSKGMNVLDAGSKDGYGSLLLSWFAKSVTLVDNNSVWLDKAKRFNHFHSKVDFKFCDFEKDFPEGKWDRIVAFEIIEHVEDPGFFLKNINDHLTDDGLLIFSIPHDAVHISHKTVFRSADEVKALIYMYMDLKEFYIQDKSPIQNIPATGIPTPLTYCGVAAKRK